MATEKYIDIGKRIRDLREQNNWTRDFFSERLQISNMYLCQLEKGQRSSSLPLTIKIAEALGVSLDYLIYGEKSIDVDKNEVIELIDKASKRQLEIVKTVLLNLKKWLYKTEKH